MSLVRDDTILARKRIFLGGYHNVSANRRAAPTDSYHGLPAERTILYKSHAYACIAQDDLAGLRKIDCRYFG